jgi:hypothetical protein
MQLCLEYMRFVKKHRLAEHHDDINQHNYQPYDETLVASWSSYKKEQMPLDDWLRVYQPLFALLRVEAEVAKVMSVETSWIDDRQELRRLCNFKVGRMQFGWCMQNVLGADLGLCIQEKLSEMKGKPVTEECSDEAKRMTIQGATSIPGVAGLADRRKVAMSYRGVAIELWVGSIVEEVNFRFSCALKEWGGRQGRFG